MKLENKYVNEILESANELMRVLSSKILNSSEELEKMSIDGLLKLQTSLLKLIPEYSELIVRYSNEKENDEQFRNSLEKLRKDEVIREISDKFLRRIEELDQGE